TALRAVIVTGFANENRLRRWAKPFSPGMFWVVIAQQVRDSTVNSNRYLSYHFSAPASIFAIPFKK
ncbi:MAG: hypothetical protein IJ600_06130, partial [Lachnospiraceae bacterium]|nr:hypothetical protein [Lachnospiraceae bacterium]